MSNNYLSTLNKEQLEAATTLNGPLLILAGAGTGKTHTLMARTMYMLDQNIDAKSILLLTFTNKAANEMKNRIKTTIGEKADDITSCTFHSFCAVLMRKFAKEHGFRNNFTILDKTDAVDAISICREEFLSDAKKKGYNYNKKTFPKSKAISAIKEVSINNCVSVDDIISDLKLTNRLYQIKDILKRYEKYKKTHNCLDYDDLLFYTNETLKNNELARMKLDETYKYIMCDEYQDTNIIQDSILNLISKNYNNLAVVGDDNQSIYAFRGANINNILNFSKNHNNCNTIILKENYRSSQEILDLANKTMDHAVEGIPKSLNGQFTNVKPNLFIVPNSYSQTSIILDSIEMHHKQGLDYKQMAVICRSALQLQLIEIELNKYRIPYEKFGGIKFFEKSAIKDILAFFKVLVNPYEDLAWYRILQLYPGIGKSYASKISKNILKNGKEILTTIYSEKSFAPYLRELSSTLLFANVLDFKEKLNYLVDYYEKCRTRMIEESKKDEETIEDDYKTLHNNMNDINYLVMLAKKYNDLYEFLSDIILDSATPEKEGDYVNLTTIHSAKGLEYDLVFMPDIIQEITPKTEIGDPEDPEELRCFYVALTRAKKELNLFVTKKSNTLFKPIDGKLSHFIDYNDVLECFETKKLVLAS